jgi:hypothetical protein
MPMSAATNCIEILIEFLLKLFFAKTVALNIGQINRSNLKSQSLIFEKQRSGLIFFIESAGRIAYVPRAGSHESAKEN